MKLTLFTTLFAGGLFLGMLVLLEAGRRVGAHRLAKDAEGARAGTSAVEGALFALLGLLLAFTFSSAATRFETRRQLVVEEANNIGTAWLRLDLLPANAQPAVRDLFRRYVDSRVATYRRMHDIAAAKLEIEHSVQIQNEIWAQSVAAAQPPEGQRVAMLLLPALNQMFDIVTTRTVAAQTHPPGIIFGMLAALALATALFAGLGMGGSRRRSWIHILGFAAIMAASVYVILDLEYPRSGLIRIDMMDQLLADVRTGMK